MKILVVGATGLLGGQIASRLKEKGHSVVTFVRPGSAKEAGLRELGFEVRRGDLKDAASLESACAGIEAIVSTATAVISGGEGNSLAAVDGAGYASLIGAAKRQGVRRFVYVSVSPKLGESTPLVQHKRATERVLKASGLEYVIVQPSNFMDIWFSPALGWNLSQGKAQIFGPGTAPISFIAVADVAAYAVAVLEDLNIRNQEIPLGGPAALPPRRALEVIEQVAGKKFKVTTLPGFVPQVASAVLKPFNPKLASLMALGAETLTGDVIDSQRALSLAAIRLTPLEEWATQTLGRGTPAD